MITEVKYHKELDRLQVEQQFLEEEIDNLMKCKIINQFRLMDLKKKKTRVEESIVTLQGLIYTDITA
jgi:hypothetical protein